mmetsp:Transcript_57580/g.162397  ORF Transcript_57580/g.162397 Transcript_57580/m.162397 type:complete len:483 (-) Transcript_57580:54-1502(-)
MMAKQVLNYSCQKAILLLFLLGGTCLSVLFTRSLQEEGRVTQSRREEGTPGGELPAPEGDDSTPGGELSAHEGDDGTPGEELPAPESETFAAGTTPATSEHLPLQAHLALWSHLRTWALPHRSRLGPVGELTVVGSGVSQARRDALQAAFRTLGRPRDAGRARVGGAESRVYVGGGCAGMDSLAGEWKRMGPGSILAVPVCNLAEYDNEADQLLYTVNCKMMFDNHKCGRAPGRRMACADFPFDGLHRLSFVPHFWILEKRDTTVGLRSLGGGDFLSIATAIKPVTTDKVTKHEYQTMYERYLPAKRPRSEGTVLEIGLGCGMYYGPGKSAILWREYFPRRDIEFVELKGDCVKHWENQTRSLRISVHIGDQIEVARRIAESARHGYDIIVDDGSHRNRDTNACYDYLWPLVEPDGFYFMEDIGSPAFSWLDCEPIQSIRHRQNSTTLAKLINLARPLVLALGHQNTARIECMEQICLLHKT